MGQPNEESIALDFKAPRGRAILDELIASADAVIHHLAPGTAAKMGVTGPDLVAKHPRLIACDLSGYGDGGSYATKRVYGLLVQGESASIATTGWPDLPAKP